MISTSKKSASQKRRKPVATPKEECRRLLDRKTQLQESQNDDEDDFKLICVEKSIKICVRGLDRDILQEFVQECEKIKPNSFLSFSETKEPQVIRMRQMMNSKSSEFFLKEMNMLRDMASGEVGDETDQENAKRSIIALGEKISNKETMSQYFHHFWLERALAADASLLKRHPELNEVDPYWLFWYLDYKNKIPLLALILGNAFLLENIYMSYVLSKIFLLYSRQETSRHKSKDPWGLFMWWKQCGKAMVRNKSGCCSAECRRADYEDKKHRRPDPLEQRYGAKFARRAKLHGKLLQKIKVAVGPPLLRHLQREEKFRRYILSVLTQGK